MQRRILIFILEHRARHVLSVKYICEKSLCSTGVHYLHVGVFAVKWEISNLFEIKGRREIRRHRDGKLYRTRVKHKQQKIWKKGNVYVPGV